MAALSPLIRSEEFDMLIPCSDTALTMVAQHYEHLGTLLRVACPPPHIVKRVLDKNLTLEVAKRCGIAIPATYLVSNSAELEALRGTLRFPMIAKPRSKSEASSFKTRYFQSLQELSDEFKVDPHFGARNLLQEYCVGEGVGIATLIHDGEPVAMFQHRRLRELPSSGGVSVLAISETVEPGLKECALTLLRNLEWEGIAMVEFRYDRARQTAVLMEVNGRYWGSLSLAIHAGIDFPFYEWQVVHGEQPSVPADYRVGMRMRWTTGDLLRLYSLFTNAINDGFPRSAKWNELFQFVAEFRFQTGGALWSVRDPVPALAELGRTFKDLAVAEAKKIIKKLLPHGLIKQIQFYRSLDPQERSAYLRLHFVRALGVRRDDLRRIRAEIRSILFVCHGNIIRSPMGEALLTQCLSEIDRPAISIVSAGLHAIPDRKADPRALIVAREFGISLENHRTQPITQELVERADAIFVMDFLGEVKLLARYPEAGHKIFMLGAIDKERREQSIEIVDPFAGDTRDIRRCYEILQSKTHSLVRLLSQPDHLSSKPLVMWARRIKQRWKRDSTCSKIKGNGVANVQAGENS
jgi:protein-tyrosine-phosphatase/predicted ATP-grasp superfamily ATP-dependent carboligase